MAIPWIAVLSQVPWADVIDNAPKVADGAKKLWTMVVRRPAADAADDSSHGALQARTPVALEKRIVALEAKIAGLDAQMIASVELIKALAEQNAQLIARVERNRNHLRWLVAATLATALAALAALIFRV